MRKLIKSHPGAKYYQVIGKRSNGKTWSSIDMCLDNFINTGKQFAYVRRYKDEMTSAKLSELFADHVAKGLIAKKSDGEWNGVAYKSSKFYLTYTNEEGEEERRSIPMGYAFALNVADSYKSISFPNITTVVLDEFLSRNGYLHDEFMIFTNLLSTIIRSRSDVTILMLGNTVNRYCPYFAEMGIINIAKMEPGTIDVYHYGDTSLKVVVEYCDPLTGVTNGGSEDYFAFNNPKLQMITTGEWEIGVYAHLTIKYRPKDIQYNAFIDFNKEILHLELVATDETYFLFVHPKTTPIKDEENDVVYTDYPSQRWNYRFCLTRQRDKLSQAIMNLINTNRVFFSDNSTGEVFRNYLMYSDQYDIKGI